MVVDIFIAKAETIHPLREHLADTVIDKALIPVIIKAPGQPINDGFLEINLAQQECPGVAGDLSTVMFSRSSRRNRRAMDKESTSIWDAAEHLETDEDMAAYLEAALEENDSSLIAAVLGDIARAKGMSQIARQAGRGRESLYKALATEGNPEFATILKVVCALGLQLHATLGKEKSIA